MRYAMRVTGKGETAGAVALVTGGLGAAFSAAACCGLPVLLAGFGVGTSWLIPLAAAVGPAVDLLMLFAGLALLASLAVVLRRPRSCAPGSLCARPPFRAAIGGAALLGLALLAIARP
jgi:mercuric ion transport protein